MVTVITKNAINNKFLSDVHVKYTMSNMTEDTIITNINGRGEIYPTKIKGLDGITSLVELGPNLLLNCSRSIIVEIGLLVLWQGGTLQFLKDK